MPDVTTTGNDSEKVARAWHSIYNSWQHRRWDGGLFGWHLTAAVVSTCLTPKLNTRPF